MSPATKKAPEAPPLLSSPTRHTRRCPAQSASDVWVLHRRIMVAQGVSLDRPLAVSPRPYPCRDQFHQHALVHYFRLHRVRDGDIGTHTALSERIASPQLDATALGFSMARSAKYRPSIQASQDG